MYFVYVLKSTKDKELYYGLTANLENRLVEHNKGKVQATKGRTPFDIVYFETVANLTEARRKEKYFKSGFGRKYIKNKLSKTDGLIV
jgi:putative endonuclease